MTELEKLKQQLNEISEKVKQLENPNLDTNKWYFYENKILLYIEKFNNIDITGYGFASNGTWHDSSRWIDSWRDKIKLFRPATDKEVEEALIKEAKRRGFKKGVKVSRKNKAFSPNLGDSELEMNIQPMYKPEFNRLEVYGCSVFQNGFWNSYKQRHPECRDITRSRLYA